MHVSAKNPTTKTNRTLTVFEMAYLHLSKLDRRDFSGSKHMYARQTVDKSLTEWHFLDCDYVLPYQNRYTECNLRKSNKSLKTSTFHSCSILRLPLRLRVDGEFSWSWMLVNFIKFFGRGYFVSKMTGRAHCTRLGVKTLRIGTSLKAEKTAVVAVAVPVVRSLPRTRLDSACYAEHLWVTVPLL